MNDTERQGHWERIYATKGESGVSWFQETPAPTLDLLALVGVTSRSSIVDVGGGASRLVDHLLARGYDDVTVLDLSQAALAATKRRLGALAEQVRWIVADVTTWEPTRSYDVWHDRAAFHFLTDPADQCAYCERLRNALRQGGVAIIGTFAPDGPERCSGLPVARWNAERLHALLGPEFVLVDARRHDHVTPAGVVQRFQFSTFRRLAGA